MPHEGYKVGVMSDLHGLFHDPRALAAFFRTMEAFEPDLVGSIGDLADFYQLSKYDKDPERATRWSVKRERRRLAPVLDRVDELSRDAPFITLGNHEARWATYLRHNAPALSGLDGLTVEDVLGIPDRWRALPYGKVFRLGKLGFTHGDVLRSQAGASALAQRAKVGGSVIMGHSHRLGGGYFSDSTGQYGAWEIGHLARPPVYSDAPQNWQQGFAAVTFGRGGTFTVDLVPVHKGRAWFRGEWL